MPVLLELNPHLSTMPTLNLHSNKPGTPLFKSHALWRHMVQHEIHTNRNVQLPSLKTKKHTTAAKKSTHNKRPNCSKQHRINRRHPAASHKHAAAQIKKEATMKLSTNNKRRVGENRQRYGTLLCYHSAGAADQCQQPNLSTTV